MATSVTKATGSSGSMRIWDDGSLVSFQLKAASGTFNHDLPYGYTVNGVTDNSNTFDYVGTGGYLNIKQWTVSSDQTVTFRLQDSGTSGIGGPTTLSMAISRSTVPAKSTAPAISALTNTSFTADTNSNGNGGGTIDSAEIGISTAASSSPTIVYTASGIGVYTVTGRVPGTVYRVYGRFHNENGWGPWSAYTTVTTLDVPDAPHVPTVSNIKQSSVDVTFVDGANGGSPITGRTIGYSTSTAPGEPQYQVPADADGTTTITGLTPGTTWYFWSRTTNKYGDSVWSSAPASAKTTAGVLVKDGTGPYKPAVPYVNVNGVWHIATPWGKVAGVWKQTTT